MTVPFRSALVGVAFALGAFVARAAPAVHWLTKESALIVVEDRGGTSALPYYQALNLRPNARTNGTVIPQGVATVRPSSEADMLPVRSTRLTPGMASRQVIHAPGLRPLFLIGDDAPSRAWLEQRWPVLRKLNAVGLVVQVETLAALTSLRALAPGLTLSPVSGDDLAARLGLHHYPVLITPTGIEQ